MECGAKTLYQTQFCSSTIISGLFFPSQPAFFLFLLGFDKHNFPKPIIYAFRGQKPPDSIV